MIEKTKKYYKHVIYYFEHTSLSPKILKILSSKPNCNQTLLYNITKNLKSL